MMHAKRILLAGAALSLLPLFGDAADPAPPMVIPHGQKDVRLATAGTYSLDPNHVAVIARVSHMGFSMSAFRFGKVAATLQWDPAAIAKSKLDATVETGSIETNVAGFAEELQGADYLNVAKYPVATFASSAFRQKDATHGDVDGTLSIMGKAVPVTFAVTLVGAGPGFAGGPVMGHVIGIHAETSVDAGAIGLPPIFSSPIEIAIDTEFDKRG
jgi:polyisoprenoid-binding protein YceI